MSEIMRRVIKASASGDIVVLECTHRIVMDIVPELINKNDIIPCPFCAEIKTAEDKRGEEVLEGVKKTIDTMIDTETRRKSRLCRMENKARLLKFTKKMIIQDNQLRFGP